MKLTNVHEQLNIFSFNESSRNSTDSDKEKNSDEFLSSQKKLRVVMIEQAYGLFIEEYIKAGLPVTQVCEMLVKSHNASSETFDSGKYKIYPHIMLYMDTLVDDGLCIAKQRDSTEGIFEWIETSDDNK